MAEETDTLVRDDTTDTTTDTTVTDKTTDTKTGDGTTDTTEADGGDKKATTTDDWRDQLSGGDEKTKAWLGRYATQADAIKDAKRRFDDFRGGKLVKPLGDDPSESEIKAYREAVGVPDKPEGYLEKLSGGLVVGDDDRPVVDKFLSVMHEKHVPAGITDAVLQTYYKIVEEQDATITAAVDAARVKCEDTLREEYGSDYRRNMNAAEAHLGTLPADLQEAINSGFDGKGVPLRSNPAMMQFLVRQALEANPLATIVPGLGSNQPSAIADRIKEIEGIMRTDPKRYRADASMRAQLRDLYAAREKLGDQK